MNIESRERLITVVKKGKGKLSQRAYARSLGVSPSAVQDWENGAVIPDTENLTKIAVSVGYSLDELINYLESGHAPKITELDRILDRINALPPKQVAEIARAAQDRLVAVALGN